MEHKECPLLIENTRLRNKISYIDKCKQCNHCGIITAVGWIKIISDRIREYYCTKSDRTIDVDGNKTIPEWCELPNLTLNEAFEKWIAIKYPQHAEEIKSNPEILHKILEEK